MVLRLNGPASWKRDVQSPIDVGPVRDLPEPNSPEIGISRLAAAVLLGLQCWLDSPPDADWNAVIVTDRWDAETTLRSAGLLADEAIDLADAALAFAALDRPEIDPEPYRIHLAGLTQAIAEAVHKAPAFSADDQARCLVQVLRADFGYTGDIETYEDLRNANLMSVIDRRKGLPVSLGILFIHAARHCGWIAHGLNFPGHFLIRLEVGGDRLILDPFHDGATRTAAELRDLIKQSLGPDAELQAHHYETVGNRDILLRLQNNIKLRHLRASRIEAAAQVVHRMLLLAPEETSLWREMGMIEAHQGHLNAAIAALETFLNLAPDDEHRRQTTAFLKQLRGRLN